MNIKIKVKIMNKETRLGVLEGILKECFGEHADIFKASIPLIAKAIDQSYSVDEGKVLEMSCYKSRDEFIEALCQSDEVLKVNPKEGNHG